MGMMTKIAGALALAIAFAGTASAHDRTARSTPVPKVGSHHKQALKKGDQAFLGNDRLFLWRVHWVNHSEMQSGEMAKAKGSIEGLEEFGDMLIEDHARAELQLVELANEKDLQLQLTREEYRPVRDRLARQMTMQMDLAHEEGAEFDEQFLTHMVDEHVAAIDLLRSYRPRTKDADIRAYIDEILPVLQRHHRTAAELLDDVRNARQNVKGTDDEIDIDDIDEVEPRAPETQPGEEPQMDEPEEGTDRQEDLQQQATDRTRPPPHLEERYPPD